MEKEHSPESLATVAIKPDYPPSEYSSEPPPAYHKPHSAAVQVAKIVAVTVVLVSVVLGSFLLASAYVTANASCRQLEQELELLSEAADRFQSQPQPEALIQEEPLHQKRHSDPLQTDESQKNTKEIDNNNIDSSESNDGESNSDSSSSSESDEEVEERTPVHFRLPLQLDFDDLAGALIEKNQRSRMNCIVEKKRAEEVVDHQPKTLRLPFGVNLTTDPRLERLTGERMVIVCESGNMQRAQPSPPAQPEEEEEQDTIMIQPVMIPIPQSAFQTHMPQQMPPPMQPQQQMRPMHPMETMRPPMPPMRQQMMPMRPPMPPMRPPMEQMMPTQVRIQAQVPNQQQPDFPPNPIIHHIIQQIIAQKIMESQKAQEEQQAQEGNQQEIEQSQPRPIPENMMAHRIPIPEEILTQLNRLPNNDRVIVAVSEPDSSEENSQEMQVVQEQRQSAAEMNGRQTYARGIPVHIPVPMMPQVHEQEIEHEPQAVASEESRPHYVQPRSVPEEDAPKSRVARSANPLLPEKRVKRCACDCAC